MATNGKAFAVSSKDAALWESGKLEKFLNTLGDIGLTAQEAEKRLSIVGPNELAKEEEESLIKQYFDQFKQPLVLMLLGSALISLLIRHYSDAISITVAIVIVCTVAFIQEYRSQNALEALNKLVEHTCKVLRNGEVSVIPASQLVPGDVLVFGVGDRVAADVRIIKANHLTISEAELTGEPNAIEKQSGPLTDVDPKSITEESITDRKNLAFMGTMVHSGNGRGIVYATGETSQLGIISKTMSEVEEKDTPLQQSMEQLGKQISSFAIVLIIIVFFIGVSYGRNWLNMFTMGVAMAVAAIPEGLPIVTTVTLAMGVIRMSHRNAIVKKLPSVETLGSCDVICADKTGTLTMNQMTVKKLYTLGDDSFYDCEGVGLDGRGKILKAGKEITSFSEDNKDTSLLFKLFQIGNLCNNASLPKDNADGKPIGDATDVSLLVVAKKAQIYDLRDKWTVESEIPFNSQDKWMSVVCSPKEPSGNSVCFVKGAYEKLLPRCDSYLARNGEVKQLLDEDIKRLQDSLYNVANQSMRTILLCYGDKDDGSKLTIVGFVGILDPPRPGVKETIKKLRDCGVRTIMITGDSKPTAISIATDLGIYNSDYNVALSPDDIDDSLEGRIGKVCVFYRMSAKQKMAIVQAFQNTGHIVAMTGDGVNDSVALKKADIGIAMGSGTDVSKEAAKMILVDDDFSTIVAAIEEGKSIFNGIKNFLRFQVTTSIAALSMITLTNIIGYPSPLNPMQILYINIIMDGPPAQTLGIEPLDPDILKQPPRAPGSSIITARMLVMIFFNVFLMVCGTLFIYFQRVNDGNISKEDVTMTFVVFIMFQIFNAINCRSETKSIFTIGFFKNTPFLIAIGLCVLGTMALVYLPILQPIFETYPIDSFKEVAVCFLISSSVFIAEVLVKWLSKHKYL